MSIARTVGFIIKTAALCYVISTLFEAPKLPLFRGCTSTLDIEEKIDD